MINCKTVWLRKGDTGPIITELEVFLKAKNKYPYKLDQRFGPGVDAGVRSLQHDLKIKEDGIFGPETCSKSGVNSKPTPTPLPPKGKWWSLFQEYMGIVVNSATEVYNNLTLHGAHYSFYENDKQSNLQVLVDLKNGGGSNCTDIAQLLKRIYEEMGYTVRFIREEVRCSNGEWYGHVFIEAIGHELKEWTKIDGAGRLEKGPACPIGTLICTHGERNRSVNPAWLMNAQDNR